jgi:diguanylate cyclase (GGDEF)-like protein
VNWLNRLELRSRIQLGFVASAVLAVLLVGLGFSNLYARHGDFHRLSSFNSDMQRSLSLAQDVISLQSAAELYMHDGHESARRAVDYSFRNAREHLVALSDSPNAFISSRLPAIDEHLRTFYEVFGEAQRQRQARAALTDSAIRTLGSAARQQLQALADGSNRLPAAIRPAISDAPYNLLQIENSAYRYFDALEGSHMREARRRLSALQQILQEAGTALADTRELASMEAAIAAVNSYSSAIIEAEQRTRGYYFLTNVVLAGEAYEMLYQARQLVSAVEREMLETDREAKLDIDRGIARSVALSVALLLLMLGLAYVVARSIALPISELAETFRQLASGVQRAPIEPLPMGGELGELAYAAEIFRRKNDETEHLLARARQQGEELEARVAERTQELRIANSRLQQLSDTDGLTGLYNRRHFDEVLARDWARAVRQREPLAAMMLDVDHFKAFNDHYGHPAGDACLQQLAQLLRNLLRRDTDLVARYGGEEFVMLLPDTTVAGALELAEQIRSAVHTLSIAHSMSSESVVTVSIGVAVFHPGSALQDTAALLRAADHALYVSKHGGRNRVTLYQDTGS